MSLMRTIKRAIDPTLILNPEKIFDKSELRTKKSMDKKN